MIVGLIDGNPDLIVVGGDLDIPPDYCRIVLVRRGALLLRDGARERTLLPRDAILLSPWAEPKLVAGHGAVTAQLGFGRSALAPETLGGEAGELLGILGERGKAFRAVRMPPAPFEEACSIVLRLADEAKESWPGVGTMRRLRLAELLILFHRFDRGPGAGEGHGFAEGREQGFKVEELVRHIDEHYAEELSLSGLASRYGLNPSYLSRSFAAHTGVHLMEYINRTRIEKGCALLKRSSLSIVEIAYAVGYNNLSHFNRYFRRIMDMSPSEYRRLSKK